MVKALITMQLACNGVNKQRPKKCNNRFWFRMKEKGELRHDDNNMVQNMPSIHNQYARCS